MDDDCDQEWEAAYFECENLLSQKNPPIGVTGGCMNIHQCAKGLVSQLCGGNLVVN